MSVPVTNTSKTSSPGRKSVSDPALVSLAPPVSTSRARRSWNDPRTRAAASGSDAPAGDGHAATSASSHVGAAALASTPGNDDDDDDDDDDDAGG